MTVAPLMLGVRGPVVGEDELAFMREAKPASVIVFARNIESPEQLRRLTDSLREVLAYPLIAVDQEGGRVQRLAFGGKLPPAKVLGEWYDVNPAVAREAAKWVAFLLANQLREVGATWMLAPVLDVGHAKTHAIIGDRAFHHDPCVVAELGQAYCDGVALGGCVPCIKHAPGHGRACADSHVELPRVDACIEELEHDWLPFRELAPRVPFMMTAHVKYDALDGGKAATLAPEVLGMMRENWGFNGLIVADDLGMKALEGDYLARGRAALAAGCDMVITSFSKIQHGMAGTVFDEETYGEFVAGYDLPQMNMQARGVLDALEIPPRADAGLVAEAKARLQALWDDGPARMGYNLAL